MGFLPRSLVLIPLLLLSGCFEYEESIWLERSGSARIVCDYALLSELVEPDKLAEARAEGVRHAQKLSRVEGVREASFRDEVRGELHHFVFDVRVGDRTIIAALLNQGELGLGDGSLELQPRPDGKIRYRRNFDGQSARRRGRDRAARLGLLKLATSRPAARATSRPSSRDEDPFAGRHFTFRVHAPRVLDGNLPGQVERSRVTWKLPLSEDQRGDVPPFLTANLSLAPANLEWWIAGAVLACLLFMVWLRNMWRRGLVRRAFQRAGLI